MERGDGVVVVVGISKAKCLKAKYEVKLELLKGWENGLKHILSGRVWRMNMGHLSKSQWC